MRAHAVGRTLSMACLRYRYRSGRVPANLNGALASLSHSFALSVMSLEPLLLIALRPPMTRMMFVVLLFCCFVVLLFCCFVVLLC